jgi:hypothetical protein
MDAKWTRVIASRSQFGQEGLDSILEGKEVIIFALIPLEIPQTVFGVQRGVDVEG